MSIGDCCFPEVHDFGQLLRLLSSLVYAHCGGAAGLTVAASAGGGGGQQRQAGAASVHAISRRRDEITLLL